MRTRQRTPRQTALTTLSDLPDDVLDHIASFLSSDDDTEAAFLSASSALWLQRTHDPHASRRCLRQCCWACFISPALKPSTLTVRFAWYHNNTALLTSTRSLPAAMRHVQGLHVDAWDCGPKELLDFLTPGQHRPVDQLLTQVNSLELKHSGLTEHASQRLASSLQQRCPNLVRLVLTGSSHLRDCFWSELVKGGTPLLAQLKVLEVRGYRGYTDDYIPVEALSKMEALEELHLGVGVKGCALLPHLRKLNCDELSCAFDEDNKLSTPFLKELHVEYLDLEHDFFKFVPSLPEGLQQLSTCIGMAGPFEDEFNHHTTDEVASLIASLPFRLHVKRCWAYTPFEASLAVLRGVSAQCGHDVQALDFVCGAPPRLPPVASVVELFPCLKLLSLADCLVDEHILEAAACAWGSLAGLNIHLPNSTGKKAIQVMDDLASFHSEGANPDCSPLRVCVSTAKSCRVEEFS